MAVNLDKVTEEISNLTLLDVAQLVKQLEEKLGVTAAAPVAYAGPAAAGAPAAAEGAAAVEEKTEFTPVLTEIGANKINVIKVVREITQLGLKEAKDLVDGAPKEIKEGVTREEADSIKAKLTEVGATVEIK
ncbi:MAG TPA: 50S ribosomal protein L7/L12 [Chloroflexota bacterium]|jgi:large subunit ribosomal protein L7/L12|nr:50S ribosomal protein L7/L12 [Chloroflexota bacterium]